MQRVVYRQREYLNWRSCVIHLHVPSDDRQHCSCRCHQSLHIKWPVPQFLLVSLRWCACLLPFTIFPFPLPERPTHTWPIVCWYDLSNADASDTYAHTHTHTEALSVTASLFTHRDTLSTFIALSQWGTLCLEKPRTPRPSASTPSAPGLDCPRVTARLL